MSLAPDAVLSAIIAYMREAMARYGVTSPTTRAIIRADQAGTKPAEPFLTIRVLTWGRPEGLTAEARWSTSPEGRIIRHYESGTLSIQGYGADTARWLEAIRRGLDHDDLDTALAAAGLFLEPLGGLTNLSAALETGTEARFSMDLECRYIANSTPAAIDEATIVRVDPLTLVRYEGAEDPLTGTVVADWTPE